MTRKRNVKQLQVDAVTVLLISNQDKINLTFILPSSSLYEIWQKSLQKQQQSIEITQKLHFNSINSKTVKFIKVKVYHLIEQIKLHKLIQPIIINWLVCPPRVYLMIMSQNNSWRTSAVRLQKIQIQRILVSQQV